MVGDEGVLYEDGVFRVRLDDERSGKFVLYHNSGCYSGGLIMDLDKLPMLATTPLNKLEGALKEAHPHLTFNPNSGRSVGDVGYVLTQAYINVLRRQTRKVFEGFQTFIKGSIPLLSD